MKNIPTDGKEEQTNRKVKNVIKKQIMSFGYTKEQLKKVKNVLYINT